MLIKVLNVFESTVENSLQLKYTFTLVWVTFWFKEISSINIYRQVTNWRKNLNNVWRNRMMPPSIGHGGVWWSWNYVTHAVVFCRHQISSKLSTSGWLWTNVLDSALHQHQQNTKLGNIFWKNTVHPSSKVQRLEESVPRGWPITWLRYFVCFFL